MFYYQLIASLSDCIMSRSFEPHIWWVLGFKPQISFFLFHLNGAAFSLVISSQCEEIAKLPITVTIRPPLLK